MKNQKLNDLIKKNLKDQPKNSLPDSKEEKIELIPEEIAERIAGGANGGCSCPNSGCSC